MIYDATTKKVKADNREGKVRVFKEGPAKIIVWSDYRTGKVDEGLYTFPLMAAFEKVKQSSGRIYILRYFGSDRRFFFWMQEDPSKDEDICKRVNELINEQVDAESADVSEPMEGVESAAEEVKTSQAARDAQAISRLAEILAGRRAPKEKSMSRVNCSSTFD